MPACIAYIPLLLTHPGMVGADTKTYLYLDPAKLLGDAPYVWDSQIGLGTVTHQNIGYLFPMGPFYLVFAKLGVPDWVAQRLWLGTVLFVAAMGVRSLLRTLGRTPEIGADGAVATSPRGAWRGLGPWAVLTASLAYMLSPYVLEYSARISVILLPWCALPWLIALTAKSVRNGGWRDPAWFAFVVLLVGGINATALIMIAWGPLLWVLHAVLVDKESTARQALAAVARMGVLTVATSLWWIAGLWAEGRFGLPVIRYTESYRTVAEVSNAPEVLRGLGYWFFYGTDKLGPWIEPSEAYTTQLWLLSLSYLLPILAFVSAALVRWRYRAYFIALVVLGGLTAVASNPWRSPSFLGLLFQSYSRTDAGLSLRSTPRAVPLVVLGTAVFLGAGVDALGRRLPRLAVPIAVGVMALVVANMPPMWNGTMVAKNLERPEQIPSYWNDDAAYLQSRGSSTRVLEIPGADFASYRWGNTVDPVLPGLMDRPYVARELFTWGSPPSANLLNALDRRFHEEALDPQALVPIAQLMGVGDINVRSDLQYERYRIARPKTLWALIRSTPGLGDPVEFGPNDPPNVAGPTQTMIDEVEQGTDPTLPEPPRVAAFPVQDPRPILRTVTGEQPLLMAADGEGLVDAASQGLVNPDQAVFYSASFAKDPAGFDRVYGSGADLMLTDTNRKRARRWGALRENTGITERAGETPAVYDSSDQRLDVFPGAGDDSATVTEQRAAPGATIGATATASGYGNPITYTPDDRPANALDGDPETAWRVGAISDVLHEKLFIDLTAPVTTDHVNLLQPINLERTRWITKARLTFDRGTPNESAIDVDLTDQSRDESAVGQDVPFTSRTFQNLTIEVLDTNLGTRTQFDGVSGVGFAEVRIPGVTVDELVRMPSDLLARAGTSSLDHRLTLLATRLRSNPAEPVRTDEEEAMHRVYTLPTARSFSVGGTARLSTYRTDAEIDQLLGLPDAAHGGVTSDADVRLPGSLQQRASAAIDGDLSTAWTSIYQKQTGHWLEYTVPAPLTFDHLDLDIVADGRHSVPTKIRIDADGSPSQTVTLAPIADLPPIDGKPQLGKTVHQRVDLPAPVTGSKIRFTIEDVRPVETAEWYSSSNTVTPVSIAELGVPGLRAPPTPATFDSGCRADLLSVDGTGVWLRVLGPTRDAVTRNALPVEPCTPSADERAARPAGAPPAIDATVTGIPMSAGEHVLRSGTGRLLGINVDRLALASDRGGAMLPLDQLPSQVPAPPPTTVDQSGRVDAQLTVTDATRPFWLVQGQSWSTGWHAAVNGVDLGAPVTINGFANGWYVDPAVTGAGPLTLTIAWTPQRLVWIFIGISIVTLLVCLALMLFGRRPRLATAVPAEPARPLHPQLPSTWPWVADPATETPPVGRRAALLAAVGFGVFAAVDLPTQWGFPLLAVPLAGALYVSLRRARSRSWLGLAAVASYALAALYVVGQEARWRYASSFVWPTLFSRVHILGLLAMFLLGAEAVRDVLRRPPRPDERPGAAPSADPTNGPDAAPDAGPDAGPGGDPTPDAPRPD